MPSQSAVATDVLPDSEPPPRLQSTAATDPALLATPGTEGSNGAHPGSAFTAPSASETNKSAQTWLTAQCGMISGTRHGAVLEHSENRGCMQCVAFWPPGQPSLPPTMLNAARVAYRDQNFAIVATDNSPGKVPTGDAPCCFVASPLIPGDATGPVAVFELPVAVREQQQAIEQLLQWGAVWFSLLQQQQPPAEADNSVTSVTSVLEILADSLEQSEFTAATIAIVSELANRLKCTRVSLGLVDKQSISVYAISNTTRIDVRSNLTRAISEAMNEAVDQGTSLATPALPDSRKHVTYAQAVLIQRGGATAVLSIPLYDNTNAIGALTLERDATTPFNHDDQRFCELLGALIGPVIKLKHDNNKPIATKVWISLREFTARLWGGQHVATKMYTLLLLAIFVFFGFATGDYRITSPARLEGTIKRVVAAPRDGFIANATMRAGDIVQAGDLLASLDSEELQLEQLKLNSQIDQLDKEKRAALSSGDRSTTAIVNAQHNQTAAQLALVSAQLERTRLSAPFDGIVVSGDLSQSIGSPVENGQILFEVSPLDSYRVVLEIDERDIGDIAETQRGLLTLTGLPGDTLAFTVNRVVPLSTARDGRNYFEVHAELDAHNSPVRPGMEGIGKVTVEQRKLLWIWTHRLVDWFRLALWTWVA